jgi:release factor glutamine methyltransferase
MKTSKALAEGAAACEAMKLNILFEMVAQRLAERSDTAFLDAQALLSSVLEKPRTWVLAHPDSSVDRKKARQVEAQVKRLEAGEPLPYVLGRWEFFGLEFEVTPEVLIPRPETELLVETALHWLKARPACRRVLDVGTGSGGIAVTLAVTLPDVQVLATDVSPTALDVARRNALKMGVEKRVTLLEADLVADPVPGDPFALVVSNLPYIPTATLKGLSIYRREPTLALDGGPDGLSLIRRLVAAAPRLLAPGGLLLLEIEASEGPAALSLAYDAFERASIHLHQDLAGHDRLLEVQI